MRSEIAVVANAAPRPEPQCRSSSVSWHNLVHALSHDVNPGGFSRGPGLALAMERLRQGEEGRSAGETGGLEWPAAAERAKSWPRLREAER